MPARLVVVDRDTRYGEWLRHHLGVLCPDSPVSLLNFNEFERWREELAGRDCDVLILCVSFGSSPEDPQAQGLELLRQLREREHFPAVIAVAEEGNELTAVRALQLGALDYLPKRLLTPDRLKTSVRLALRRIEKRVARRLASLAQAQAEAASASQAGAPSDITPRPTTPATPTAPASVAPAITSLDDSDGGNTTAAGNGPRSVGSGNTPTSANTAESGSPASSPSSSAGLDVTVYASFNPDWAYAIRPGDTVGSAGRLGSNGAASGASPPDGAIASSDLVDLHALLGANGRAASSDTVIRDPARPAASPIQGNTFSDSAAGSTGLGIPSTVVGANGRPAAGDTNIRGTALPDSAVSGSAPVTDSQVLRESTGRAVAKQSTERAAAPITPATAPGGEFMPAHFIPGYTIHATIGESEKAAVYVATSAALGHNVALKISKTLRDEAAGRQFLEREYTAIVAIRSPSVVQIFDYGVHAGYEYLVMEYLPRGDLKARMQQGMSEQEALRCLEQVAAALQVVHQAGLLHRDLKPPNVMLRENGDVALIDFGLARALDGSTPSTRVGVLRGSPYYMSPEQALGEVLDERSDFYSLGIMFYEMLTGRKPYTGGSAMDVLQQHVNAPVPQLPRALSHNEPLLLKLLAKSREDRFANAAELLSAIAAGRAGRHLQSSAA